MTMKMRLWIAGVTCVAIAGLISMSGLSYAQGAKGLNADVIKIAALIKKGDNDGAKKLAAASAKNIEDLADLMHCFRPRKKGGVGVGAKPLAVEAKDGIGVKLRELAGPGANPSKDLPALEEMGYYLAALGELSAAKGWAKDQGKRTKKGWGDFSTAMREAGINFAKASAGGKTPEIAKAATKANDNCASCHNVFKD